MCEEMETEEEGAWTLLTTIIRAGEEMGWRNMEENGKERVKKT